MPIYAQPGAQFEASLIGAPSGLAGTVGVQIIDPPAGTVMLPRTTAGITEHPAGSGIYGVTLYAPATRGQYSVVWDTGLPITPENSTAEDLFIAESLPTPVSPDGPFYATVDDLRAYMGVTATDLPDAEAQRLLRFAERDVDSFVGPGWDIDPYSGLKFTAADLDDHQALQLNRAACAQAEYRSTMGEEFFVRPRFSTVSGPDFSRTGTPPTLGPKAQQELIASGLVRLFARATRRRHRSVWH